MKNIARILIGVAGLIVLLFAIICPLPAVLAVPGIVWRVGIGLFGCFFACFRHYENMKKGAESGITV